MDCENGQPMNKSVFYSFQSNLAPIHRPRLDGSLGWPGREPDQNFDVSSNSVVGVKVKESSSKSEGARLNGKTVKHRHRWKESSLGHHSIFSRYVRTFQCCPISIAHLFHSGRLLSLKSVVAHGIFSSDPLKTKALFPHSLTHLSLRSEPTNGHKYFDSWLSDIHRIAQNKRRSIMENGATWDGIAIHPFSSPIDMAECFAEKRGSYAWMESGLVRVFWHTTHITPNPKGESSARSENPLTGAVLILEGRHFSILQSTAALC